MSILLGRNIWQKGLNVWTRGLPSISICFAPPNWHRPCQIGGLEDYLPLKHVHVQGLCYLLYYGGFLKWGYPKVLFFFFKKSHGHPWLGWFGGSPFFGSPRNPVEGAIHCLFLPLGWYAKDRLVWKYGTPRPDDSSYINYFPSIIPILLHKILIILMIVQLYPSYIRLLIILFLGWSIGRP